MQIIKSQKQKPKYLVDIKRKPTLLVNGEREDNFKKNQGMIEC